MLTDARFSGVSTGACIGHVGPEALAGGPIGKVRDGDLIRIVVDRVKLEGSLDLVGADGANSSPRGGRASSQSRPPHPILSPDPELPDDTRLWAALQTVGGGTWGGCVYDTDAIIAALGSGGEGLNDKTWLTLPGAAPRSRRREGPSARQPAPRVNSPAAIVRDR